MSEVYRETLLGALETVRGTAIAAPTRFMSIEEKTMVNIPTYNRPRYSTGTIAEYSTTDIAYSESVMEASGSVDLAQITYWLSLALGNPVTTTPTGAILARLHTFARNMTTDVARSVTWWWGDAATQIYMAPYHMLDSMTIGFAADADEAVSLSVNSVGRTMAAVAGPVVPATSVPQIAYGIEALLYIDTGASAIGTTAITGRLISGEWRWFSGRERKRHALGPVSTANPRTFDRTGYGLSHTELDLVFEFDDTTQYALARDATDAKTRLRLTGPVADPGGTPIRNYYVEFDMYGPLADQSWDTYMNTNRTLTTTIYSTYNADARAIGYDYRVTAQTASATV